MNLVGTSFDIHGLQSGQYLILGGIKIPAPYCTIARSDGDVVLHALSEAIFSALGLADLGTYFPDSNPETLNMDSQNILYFAIEKMAARNMVVQNVAVHILLEKPKLSDYKTSIKDNLAALLAIDPIFIAVHAGTTEKFGAVGQSQAIACFASVLLTDSKQN